jgi:hypothetical protein
MRILRPLVSGIATGIGMKLGTDLYERIKARVSDADRPLWRGRGKSAAADAAPAAEPVRPINPWRPADAEAEAAEPAEAAPSDGAKA